MWSASGRGRPEGGERGEKSMARGRGCSCLVQAISGGEIAYRRPCGDWPPGEATPQGTSHTYQFRPRNAIRIVIDPWDRQPRTATSSIPPLFPQPLQYYPLARSGNHRYVRIGQLHKQEGRK